MTSDWYEKWHTCQKNRKHIIQSWNYQNISLIKTYKVL